MQQFWRVFFQLVIAAVILVFVARWALDTFDSHPAGAHVDETSFTIGSSRDDVRAVMGPPTGVIDSMMGIVIWQYGMSQVRFDGEGNVTGYLQVDTKLRVR